jgi:SHS2 domain-containing protein
MLRAMNQPSGEAMHRHSFFDHTADLGIRLEASDFAGLIRASAEALAEASTSKKHEALAEGSTAKVLEQPADLIVDHVWEPAETDPEWVLFDWMKHWLMRFHLEQEILMPVEVSAKRVGCARIPWDPEVHGLGREVKAVTLHGFSVKHQDNGWEAMVIVDI